MKTLDGYELKEGDPCYVSCQDPMGERHISPNPRKAVYLDEYAKEMGWDFTINNLKSEGELEIIAVWKNKP